MTYVYVVGAHEEQDRVRAAMEYVTDVGGLVLPLQQRAGTPGDDVRVQDARANLDSVALCDVLWVLAPDVSSIDVWAVLGHALAVRLQPSQKTLIVVSGAARLRSAFCMLADVSVPSDVTAARRIAEIVGRGRGGPDEKRTQIHNKINAL